MVDAAARIAAAKGVGAAFVFTAIFTPKSPNIAQA